MKLLNAKEALLFELGDFGVAEDAKGKEEEMKESESGMFEVDEDGNIIGFESVEEDAVAEEEELPEETGEEEDGEQPPDLFESLNDVSVVTSGEEDTTKEQEASDDETETTEVDGVDGVEVPQTAEEIDACISAATEALIDRRMPQDMFDWGMDYIRKMGKARIENLESRWAAVDKESMRQEMEQMDAEEEEQENAEKERFIRG